MIEAIVDTDFHKFRRPTVPIPPIPLPPYAGFAYKITSNTFARPTGHEVQHFYHATMWRLHSLKPTGRSVTTDLRTLCA